VKTERVSCIGHARWTALRSWVTSQRQRGWGRGGGVDEVELQKDRREDGGPLQTRFDGRCNN